jgi:serine protease Do
MFAIRCFLPVSTITRPEAVPPVWSLSFMAFVVAGVGMIHRSVFMIAPLLLAAGATGGYFAAVLSPAFITRAEAAGLDPETARKLQGELGGRNTLHEVNSLLAKIARLAGPSVVHIQSERQVPRRGLVEETGSGVIMTSNSAPGMYVVTNSHVVVDAKLENITIHLSDATVLHPTQVWTDRKTDVAVLKLGRTDLTAARWGDSDALDIGHMVMAVGSPFGLSQSITLGIISAKGRRSLELGEESGVVNKDFLQTDAAINPGNSGGPLIDLQGQVVGINTAIASNSGGNEGIGFSIPSTLARSVMEQLISNGRVARAYLGVKLDPRFDGAKARRLSLEKARGALVTSIEANSPASRANLQIDDVILTFNGIEVLDENHLINLVSLTPATKEQKVRITLWRGGKLVAVDVGLVEKDDRTQSSLPAEPGMGTRFNPLGLTLHSLDRELAAQLGFGGETKGLLVLSVDPESPLAGEVELYDVVDEVARTPVRSIEELESLMARRQVGKEVAVKVTRHRKGEVESRVMLVPHRR